MKFGKAAQLVLAIGIFVVGFIFLYRLQQQRQAEAVQLKTQMDATQVLVPKLTADKAALEGQLSGLETDMETVAASLSQSQAKYPASVDGIDYAQLLVKLAGDRNLELVSLTAIEPATQKIENVTYTVTSFDLQLQGQVTDILDYVNVVATSPEFVTALVGPVGISVPEPLTRVESEAGVGAAAEGEEEPSAPRGTIQVDIYTYGEF